MKHGGQIVIYPIHYFDGIEFIISRRFGPIPPLGATPGGADARICARLEVEMTILGRKPSENTFILFNNVANWEQNDISLCTIK